MATIYLLSCGKRKQHQESPASEMYIGDLFKKYLRYAKEQKPDAIYILSAKYHLLKLSQIIEPYEMTLNTMSKSERLEWSRQVLMQLKSKTDIDDDQYVFLTGKNYREFLQSEIKNISCPLEGLQIGKQLSWLKNATIL